MKEELIAKIAKMKKGIASGAIPAASLPDLEKALENARKQLAKMEAEETPIKDVKAAGTPAPRAEVYAWLTDAHPTLTRSSVDALASKEFDALHANLVADVTQAFPANAANAADIAEQFLNSHLPGEGKKSEEKPKTFKVKAKVVKVTKGLRFSKRNAKTEEKPPHTYDWMHKLDEKERTKAVRLPGKYFLHVLEYDSVLKTRGVDVPLKKGDALLLNEEGYPMTFFVASQIDKQTAPWAETVTDATHEKSKERIALLEGRIAKILAAGKTGKKAQTPDSAPAKKAPEPAPAKAESKDEPAPTKRHSCTRSEGNVLRLTETFYNWLHENMWTKGLTAKDVLKIVYTKGEKAGFYVQTKHYKLFGNRIEWYKICPQTWSMTKLEKADYPKPGSYKLLLSESEIKKAKTTKGPAMYSTCLETYRKFYECSKDGSCNATDRGKIKEAWSTCGDLTLKTDKLPAWMTLLHEKVKAEQKPGEKYTDAMSRVAKAAH